MCDVIIFGAGPAGLSAAIALRQQGRSVTLLSREQLAVTSTGESLAATARLSLSRLGLWEIFQQDSHPPCYANCSAWGEAELRHYPFIQSANGHGWHIDRLLFDQRLMEKATELGVKIIFSRRHSAYQKEDNSWQIQSDQLPLPIKARFLIDATGRSSWFARQLGIERLKNDDQIALVSFLKTQNKPLADHSSLVEAVKNGWWYSSLQPDGRLACIFFTDPDLHDNRSLISPKNWFSQVQQSQFTYERISQHGYQLDSKAFFKSANSSLLSQIYGNNWLAVGDAAMSYDPLASHGLSLALVSGADAAKAVHGHLNGKPYLLEHYAMTLQKAFFHYAQERFDYYGLERRWAEAPYWKRRHSEEEHFAFLEKCVDGTGVAFKLQT